MSNKIFLVLLLVVYSFSVSSQNEINKENKDKHVKALFGADRMPKFPWGTAALTKFIYDSLRYEEITKGNKTEGKVILRFIVNIDGTISDIEVLKSLNKDCDSEAIRMVKSMPKWEPGIQDKEIVPVYYTLPISFPPTKPDTFKDMPEVLSKVKVPDLSKINKDSVRIIVEKMPQYPGGTNALILFLRENVHYPDKARKSGTQGTVFVQFVVTKNGNIFDVRVIRGIGDGCDEEAVRVVQAMPKWLPGTQDGVPVPVYFKIPIKFTLR